MPAAFLASPALLTVGSFNVEVTGAVMQAGSTVGLGDNSSTPPSAQIWQGASNPQPNIIKTLNGGFCLDVSGGSTSQGSSVIIWTCSQSANSGQMWAADSLGRLHPRLAPRMCLDSAGSSLTLGTKLVINTCSSAASQVFVPVAAGEDKACACRHLAARMTVQLHSVHPAAQPTCVRITTMYINLKVCNAPLLKRNAAACVVLWLVCCAADCTTPPTVGNATFTSCNASTATGGGCNGACLSGEWEGGFGDAFVSGCDSGWLILLVPGALNSHPPAAGEHVVHYSQKRAGSRLNVKH